MPVSADQFIVFATLAAALVMFVTGWWRSDLVALAALNLLALTGVIAPKDVFAGFSDGAVISVAAVLVMSRGLRNSGVVDVLARRLGALGERLGDSLRIALLGTVVSFLSAFINDVGTLALFMPVATRLSRKQGSPPSRILMPLAYATLLGGMTTLVGTSVNLVISAYRVRIGHGAFGMFSFTPVGVGIAIVGLTFISAVGWRLLPMRGSADSGDIFKIENYTTEVRVPNTSKVAGKTIGELEEETGGAISVVGLLRGGWRQMAPSSYLMLRVGDVLLVRGGSQDLETALGQTDLELEAQKKAEEEKAEHPEQPGPEQSDAAQLAEAVVVPGARIVGHTARELRLRDRYAINVLALARRGETLQKRLREIRFRAGDVLLTQEEPDALQHAFADLGCLPLAEREVRIGQPRRVVLAISIFAASLAAAALNLFSVPVSLTAGATAMILAGLLGLDEAYASLEGSVLLLLAAMIGVAGALQATGGSALIAGPLLALARHLSDVGAIAMIYVVTMLVSNVTNYLATAVLMAPIAQSVAAGLGVSVDPFLMAVAFGSVSAFLTPIAHPSNTLVMGPAGYEFGDYARMGLPLSVLTTLTTTVLIPIFWPLKG